jgi:putative membrane protein
MNDVYATTDRILNTPLPLAYAIAISQLTWVYILILPFQLYNTLGLVAIPGTLCKPSIYILNFKLPDYITN